MSKPTVRVLSIEEAAAANEANRGSPNRFRTVTFGSCDENSDEYDTYFVVPESVTAFDIMTGNREPMAVCFSIEDAERVAAALNRAEGH